jgi:hypothetical protein
LLLELRFRVSLSLGLFLGLVGPLGLRDLGKLVWESLVVNLGHKPSWTLGKNFYQLPFTPPFSGRLIGPSLALLPPPFHGRLIALGDCLLLERRFRRNEVGAPQLKAKEGEGGQHSPRKLREDPNQMKISN